MYTRFTAEGAEHVMSHRGSILPVEPGDPCPTFLNYARSAFQKEKSVKRDSLLDSARLLQQYFQEQQELLPYRYEYTIRMMGRDDMKTKGGGTTSGFTIDGQIYSITGGTGKCYLKRRVLNKEGTNFVGEITDVRDRKRIATDEWGDIKISRRKLKFDYPDRLEECIAFLESITPQDVKLYSYDTPPTLRQILEEYSEGGGSADWAIDEIWRKGEQGKPNCSRLSRISGCRSISMQLLHYYLSVSRVKKHARRSKTISTNCPRRREKSFCWLSPHSKRLRTG